MTLINKITPLQLQQKTKIPRNKLMKHVKDSYNKNYKTLLKEKKKKWKDILHSWMGRNDIVKMTLFPKPLYRFNVSSLRGPR